MIPDGAWIRFKTEQPIQCHAVEGWYIGVFYGPTSHEGFSEEAQLEYRNKVFAVDDRGSAVRPGIDVEHITTMQRCTDPQDIPHARIMAMGPIDNWWPRWPE